MAAVGPPSPPTLPASSPPFLSLSVNICVSVCLCLCLCLCLYVSLCRGVAVLYLCLCLSVSHALSPLPLSARPPLMHTSVDTPSAHLHPSPKSYTLTLEHQSLNPKTATPNPTGRNLRVSRHPVRRSGAPTAPTAPTALQQGPKCPLLAAPHHLTPHSACPNSATAKAQYRFEKPRTSTLHPAPCTLHPTTYNLSPACTLHLHP